MDLRDIIPGYSEAIDQESVIRDAPFLELTESLGPFHVRAMTLRDLLALKRHPLLRGQMPTVGDLVVFIRFLWVGNRRNSSISNSLAKWLFGRRCLKYVKAHYDEMLAACLDYIYETSLDGVGAKPLGWNPSYYSEAVKYIAILSRGHRFSPEYTLNLPMKVILQYAKEIDHAFGGQPVNRSDRLILDHTLSMRRN